MRAWGLVGVCALMLSARGVGAQGRPGPGPDPWRPRAPVEHDTPWRDDDTHASLGLQVSFAPRVLYGVDVWTGEIELQMGAKAEHPGYYHALIGAAFGNTTEGLPTHAHTFGASLAWPIGARLQLGVVPRIGVLFVGRHTSSSDVIEGLIGLHLRGALDVVRILPHHALYVDLRLGLDGIPHAVPATALWGSAMGIGFRY